MRSIPMHLAAVVAAALVFAGCVSRTTATFESFRGEPGTLPASLEALSGEWRVVAASDSPFPPTAIAQVGESDTAQFNVCLLRGVEFGDGTLEVRFKSVEGTIDQGGGLVWRARDAANYYVCRYNPLEKNFRVYRVVGGERKMLKSASVELGGGWHSLGVSARGRAIACSLDGTVHLEAEDDAFPEPGRIGLWTKADAQTWFDGLSWKSER